MSNDPDKRVSDYNKGFLAGQEHSIPSPETERRLENIETLLIKVTAMNETLIRMDEKMSATLALSNDVEKLKTSNIRMNTAVVIFMFFFSVMLGWFIWSLDAKIKQVVMDTTFYQQEIK